MAINLGSVLNEHTFTVHRAPQTLRVYMRALRRFHAFGVVTVSDVAVDSVRRYVEARLAKVQPQSVAVECIALCAVLAHLERTGRFDAARLAAVRRLRPEVAKPEMLSAKFLTRDEVEALATIAGRDSLTALTVWVAALTGLRAGELARLRWDDVDLAGRCLRVRWSVKGRIKTRRERVVPLVREALDVLTNHPAARVTRVTGAGLVLSVGESLSAGVVSRRILRLTTKPDAPRANLNLLRHTRASWWVQAGVSLAKGSAWLGNSPEVFASHYAGLVRGYDPDADRAG